MARESQGLQVLLIVFVMLAVVLGVTTYLYNKRADEATKAVAAAVSNEQQAKTTAEGMQKERDLLKTLIGFPERSTDEIKKQFTEDMETYGSEKYRTAAGEKPLFDSNTLYYSRLLAGMNKVILDRTAELLKSREDLDDQEKRFKSRELAKDAAIAKLNEGFGTLQGEVKTNLDAFNSTQQRTFEESKQIVKQVDSIKQSASQAAIQAAQEIKSAREQVKKKEDDVRTIAETLRKKETEEMDVPSGEIVWVSLPNKMVWINRGRADALQRQTKFTVYSADSFNAAKAVKKGTVEVTRIEGDHSAQARILDDKLADPIMAGDKVFTPLWSPGQQNHFALAGIMNLDGDGRNQLSVVRGMINEQGGKVDCELDEQGRKQGQITASTRFIVIGDPPDKSTPEIQKNNGEILRDAERYQIHKMQLSDFKQQMNYVKSSSVEHFGRSTPVGDTNKAPAAPKASKAKAAPKSEDSAP